MSNISDNAQAFGIGVAVNNEALSTTAKTMPRKLLIMATATNTTALRDRPVRIFSESDAADKFGYGSSAHRLAISAFKGHSGAVPTYTMILDINGGARATAAIEVTAQAQHRAGAIYLYIMGKKHTITIGKTDTSAIIAQHITETINANIALPFSAEVDVSDDTKVILTAREEGTFGNEITLALNVNLANGEALPNGVTVNLIQFSGGLGTPNIDAALRNLGEGDNQNKDNYSGVVHSFGLDDVILDALSEYNGIGNEMIGNYSQLCARPFRSAVVDTIHRGSSGMSWLINFGDGRAQDRTSAIVAAPFTMSAGSEVAAEFVAKAEAYNLQYAGGSLAGLILTGVDTLLDDVDNFTSQYTYRDNLLHAGIMPLIVQDGVTQLSNTITTYHPGTISQDNNAFRRFVDISKTQNILFNIHAIFSTAKWRGFSVVEDAGLVGNPKVRAKCRDRIAVVGELFSLIDQFYDMGILFSKTPSINSLKQPDAITLRPDGSGFNILMASQYSGEGGIISGVITIDTGVSN
ncbi:MAG: hypothetical protein Pg6A_15780 [Termitinemataceae bacterium]|nr:MAG: hypothetical protein Pg6A_15780 [Termitinemataceae bacterium]